MFSSASVCAALHTNYRADHQETWWTDVLRVMEKPVHFGVYLDQVADPGISFLLFQLLDIFEQIDYTQLVLCATRWQTCIAMKQEDYHSLA